MSQSPTENMQHNNTITEHPVYQIGLQTEQFSCLMLKEFNRRQIRLVDLAAHKRIFIFFLTRSIKTYLSVKELCRHGFSQDISTLLRSFLENLISTRYILADAKTADEKATRFVDYKWIVFRRYISHNTEDPQNIKDILRRKLVIKKDVVLEKVGLFKKKYHIKSDRALMTWSGRALRDMAKAADRSLLEEYDSTFRLSSRFSHPSIIGDRSYIKYIDHHMTFLPFPSSVGVHANFRIAVHYMHQFLDMFNQLFQLNFELNLAELKKELENCPEDLPRVIDETTAASLDKERIVIQFDLPR